MNYKSPVYSVTPIHYTKLQANNYNPNIVPALELKLLEKSIWEDGFTQPIVCYPLEGNDKYEIIDGFHRYTIMTTSKRIRERENEYLPVVILEKDTVNRMASTIRHNRARGFHNVELMSNIVSELVDSGMSDSWIMKNIGMDANEILRLKQVSGLAHLFLEKEFSHASD
ncbi:chromosome partitioning protein ParB [Listeria monocytogenes]|nr:chromosome partitioning protein ParB [Listeria monocytogenes]